MKVICTKCGATITYSTTVNPNTGKIKSFLNETFKLGWCESCKCECILTDVENIQKEIDDRFQEFAKREGKEPHYATCRIVWKDTNDHYDVKIQLSADSNPEVDDDIFFYCDSVTALKSLTESGVEDFIVIACYGFEIFTPEELVAKQEFRNEIEH